MLMNQVVLQKLGTCNHIKLLSIFDDFVYYILDYNYIKKNVINPLQIY